MLNFMTVLQQLCAKVKVEKVDSLYFHHPKSRIDISQESRLKLTSQEVAEWKQDLGTYLIFKSHLHLQKVLLGLTLSIHYCSIKS